MLKGMENKKKRETAKKLGLCQHCLGKGHLSEACHCSRECGIDGCKGHHHQDMVEELGLEGRKERGTINVANDEKVDLMSATMEIALESLDGRVDTVLLGKTSNSISGGMKRTN